MKRPQGLTYARTDLDPKYRGEQEIAVLLPQSSTLLYPSIGVLPGDVKARFPEFWRVHASVIRFYQGMNEQGIDFTLERLEAINRSEQSVPELDRMLITPFRVYAGEELKPEARGESTLAICKDQRDRYWAQMLTESGTYYDRRAAYAGRGLTILYAYEGVKPELISAFEAAVDKLNRKNVTKRVVDRLLLAEKKSERP